MERRRKEKGVMGRAESGWTPRTTRRWDDPRRGRGDESQKEGTTPEEGDEPQKEGTTPCDEDDLMQEENGENPEGTAPEVRDHRSGSLTCLNVERADGMRHGRAYSGPGR